MKCPYCGNKLAANASAAFCDHNPNRAQAVERWSRGDKRYSRYKPATATFLCLPAKLKNDQLRKIVRAYGVLRKGR